MGQVWFNIYTGEVFEQTRHRRMNKEKLAEEGWTLLFTKDHRFSPHGWAVDYAWCDRCQQYHCVYNSYDGHINAQDSAYISLLEKYRDCRVADLAYRAPIYRNTQAEDLEQLIELLEVTGEDAHKYHDLVAWFIRLPRRKRRKLLETDKDTIMAAYVSTNL